VLHRHAGAVPHLTLEVTESATMADPERAIAALERLAGMGLALSIDDYGTGLSTLSYLKRLPARDQDRQGLRAGPRKQPGRSGHGPLDHRPGP
jgi:predicted signal transduction protein with EAL and GGDEF domain